MINVTIRSPPWAIRRSRRRISINPVARGFAFRNAYCQGGQSPAVCVPSHVYRDVLGVGDGDLDLLRRDRGGDGKLGNLSLDELPRRRGDIHEGIRRCAELGKSRKARFLDDGEVSEARWRAPAR